MVYILKFSNLDIIDHWTPPHYVQTAFFDGSLRQFTVLRENKNIVSYYNLYGRRYIYQHIMYMHVRNKNDKI